MLLDNLTKIYRKQPRTAGESKITADYSEGFADVAPAGLRRMFSVIVIAVAPDVDGSRRKRFVQSERMARYRGDA